MNQFEFISEFKIEKAPFSYVTNFIGKQTLSPYLEQARKIKIFKPKDEAKKSGGGGAFGKFEKPKVEDENLDLKTISEEKLNDNLNDLPDEDYEDFGEIGIDLLDFAVDKIFIMLG